MRKVIARIRLNPGQGGYFDPISRIHLTYGDPERDIYSDMNVSGIKAAIRNKRISLVSGSLGDLSPAFKLVRRPDGKVALIANNKEKVVETPIPVTVQPKKDLNVMKAREDYKKPKEDAVKPTAAPELPAVTDTKKAELTVVEEQPVVTEDASKKEKKKNPFNKKKDKKSEDTQEESVETKTVEQQ